MNKENIELIRQKCIEANPEILEFRCTGCSRQYAEYVNGCPHCWREELPLIMNKRLFPNRSVRSKARPIHLADVLLAIAKLPYEDRDDWHFDVLQLTTDGARHWNMYSDDLNEQSKETINFIAEILAA